MLDMDRYKSNGKICRENIALDIRDRQISHNDILAIIEDPEIARTFLEPWRPFLRSIGTRAIWISFPMMWQVFASMRTICCIWKRLPIT